MGRRGRRGGLTGAAIRAMNRAGLDQRRLDEAETSERWKEAREIGRRVAQVTFELTGEHDRRAARFIGPLRYAALGAAVGIRRAVGYVDENGGEEGAENALMDYLTLLWSNSVGSFNTENFERWCADNGYRVRRAREAAHDGSDGAVDERAGHGERDARGSGTDQT